MKQHLLSRVLLQRFANRRNGPIKQFDLNEQAESVLKVKDAGYIPDFILVGAEEAEEAWQTVEKRLPHAFKLLDNKEIINCCSALETIRDCMALHWARSLIVEVMYRQAQSNHANQLAEDVLDKTTPEDVLRAFSGLDVIGLQSELIAYSRLRDYFLTSTDLTEFKANLFRNLFNRGKQYISRFALEFGIVSEGEFIIADAPVIAWDKEKRAVGPLQGVRLGQADVVFMVLGPKHVVALTQHNTYWNIGKDKVRLLNRLQIQGAIQSVFYRYGSGLEDEIRSMLPASA